MGKKRQAKKTRQRERALMKDAEELANAGEDLTEIEEMLDAGDTSIIIETDDGETIELEPEIEEVTEIEFIQAEASPDEELDGLDDGGIADESKATSITIPGNLSNVRIIKNVWRKVVGAAGVVVEDKMEDIATAIKNEDSSIMVFKDKQGNFRWFGWATNKYLDRELEILEEASHIEFVKYLDENPSAAPMFWSWHTPGTSRKHKADWWDYSNGFMMYSGVLEEKEALGLLAASKKNKLGMSHGFFVLRRDSNDDRVITKYRTFEVSDLPRDKAANYWTSLEVIKKEVTAMPFTDDKRDYLVEVLGEDATSKLEKSTEERAKLLDALEVESKEAEDEETPVESEDKAVTETDGEADFDSIVKVVSEAIGLDKLSELLKSQADRINEVESRLSEAEKSVDEKVADAISPPANPLYWMERPSQSKDNVLDETKKEDEALKAQGPHWFAEVTAQE